MHQASPSIIDTDRSPSAQRHRRLGRRPTVVVSAAVAALLGVGLPSAADARVPDPIRDIERHVDVAPSDRIEPLDLGCEGFREGDVASVRCRWEVPSHPRAVGVRLVRLAVGTDTGRMTVFRTNDLSENTFVDTPIRPGVRYLYALRAVDASGRLVGASRPVSAGVRAEQPTDVEVLGLRCEQISASRVSCGWSDPEAAGRVLTLWRSVDGAARERVASFPNPFPTSYVDGVPAGSSQVAYAVIVTDGDGEIVARSRAEHVRLRADDSVVDAERVDSEPVEASPPTVTTTVTTVAPSDVRPDAAVETDARPDTRPDDTRPDDTRPDDTRPDTRRDDTRPDTRPDETRPDTRPDETRPDRDVEEADARPDPTPVDTTTTTTLAEPVPDDAADDRASDDRARGDEGRSGD